MTDRPLLMSGSMVRATLRKLELRIHDTSFNIQQDDPNDPTFRKDVFLVLIKLMRRRGWTVGKDPEYKGRNWKIASKGTLRALIACHGRSIELEFWATTWPLDNRNGPRYDFDKLKRMTFLDQKRLILEAKYIREWLEDTSTLEITKSRSTKATTMTAMEQIQAGYDECCHTDAKLGRPVCDQDYNRKSCDGHMIEHGQTVWFAGRDGRLRRGKAYYNINSMWWVTDGRYERRNISCREIYCNQPENLRSKRNEKQRRERLERELSTAIRSANYRRAELLHHILFGDDPAYLIWNREKSVFYRSNCCGYTSDAISAGRYTREEAEAEVRRVPHILSLIGPDGKHVRFTSKEPVA